MKYKLISTIFLLLAVTVNAQQIDSIKEKETIIKSLKNDVLTIYGGMKHTYTQPLKWKGDDWLKFGAFAVGSGLFYITDEDTTQFFIDQDKNAPHALKEIGWYYGSPQNFFIISAGVYGYGLLAKNEKFRHTGLLIITSAAASGLVQTISKNAFGRARPSEGVGSKKFKFMSKEAGYHSFPSGHAILSFTASHAIAKQFDNIWIKSGIYAVGLIAPVSRLWAEAHWVSDVAVGMAFSIIVVDAVDNYLTKTNKTKEPKISWKLKAGVGTVGLVGTF